MISSYSCNTEAHCTLGTNNAKELSTGNNASIASYVAADRLVIEVIAEPAAHYVSILDLDMVLFPPL